MTCNSRFDWRGLLLAAGLALAGAGAFQGARGLYETTEGRYAECARETLLSGKLSQPVLDGQPHWTKPPLTYLAIMAGMRTFGQNPWGVRAYLVVAMVLATGAVWLAGSSIWGRSAGRWAGVVFATSPYVVAGAAHVVSADLLAAGWVAWAFALFWYARAGRSVPAVLGMWVCLGLGMLTKGPPALLVPAVSLPAAWLFLRQEPGWRPPRWAVWAGVALFALVGLGWYAAEAARVPGLLHYWIGDELVGRNLQGEFKRNAGFHYVFSIYLPVILLGTGPWLWMVLAKFHWLNRWRREAGGDLRRERAAWYSLAAGAGLSLLVFVLSTSKMPLYLVPLFVPLSLILGRLLDVLVSGGGLRARTGGIVAGVLLVLIIGGKGIAGSLDHRRDMTRLASALEPVLAREPVRGLYSVSGRPLHGLEFHLERVVEFTARTNLPAHAAAHASAGYVIRRRDWEQLGTPVPDSWRTESLGRHWLLLRTAPDRSRSAAPGL